MARIEKQRNSVRTLQELCLEFPTQIMLPIESIADAAYADQLPWRRGIVLYLFPQRNNVVVHHAVGHEDAGVTHSFEQMFAGENASPAADERGQQLQLFVSGFQLLAFTAQLETPQVQFEAAEAMHLTGRIGYSSAEHGPYARTRCTRTERVGHVVLRAHIESQRVLPGILTESQRLD